MRKAIISIRHYLLLFVFFFSFWAVLLFVWAVTFLLQITRFKKWAYKKKIKKILFLENTHLENAGSVYRTLKWAERLNANKLETKILFVFDSRSEAKFYDADRNKLLFFLFYCLKRIRQCFVAVRYDCVIIRRELLIHNDYGNLFMEKFMSALHPNIILDFDDDISAAKNQSRKKSLYGFFLLESSSKFIESLNFYTRFIVGSTYLKNFVVKKIKSAEEKNISIIPTCVDYEKYTQKTYALNKETIDFGWIGSEGNLFNLNKIIAPLNELAKQKKIRLIIICNKNFEAKTNFEIVNIPWNLYDDYKLLRSIDVGLMPLDDNEVTRGKGGFKLIQYMGMGIVSVASGVTINNEIIDDKINGFLVKDDKNWEKILMEVAEQKNNFSKIGIKAREKIISKFSFSSHETNYIKFVTTEIKN